MKSHIKKLKQNLANSKVKDYNQTPLLNFCSNMKRKIKIFQKRTSAKTTKNHRKKMLKKRARNRVEQSVEL